MVIFGPSLVVLLVIKNRVLQEGCYKKYAFMALSLSNLKIVSVLPTKIIIFCIQIAIIGVGVSDF